MDNIYAIKNISTAIEAITIITSMGCIFIMLFNDRDICKWKTFMLVLMIMFSMILLSVFEYQHCLIIKDLIEKGFIN